MSDEKTEKHLTFWQMMEANSKPGSTAMKNSKIFAAVYFWVVTSTTPFIFIIKIVPAEYGNESESKQFWIKVLCVWLAIETMVNWLCTRLTPTHVEGTKYRPHDDKTQFNGAFESNDNYTDNPDYCKKCDLVAPRGSKTHHCKICQRCILRRDHHCFLLGTCVGYYTQRYFAILLFYLGVSSCMCLYFFRRYVVKFSVEREDFYWTEHFLPWTLKHVIFGRVSLTEFVLLFYCYTFVWTSAMGVGLFGVQMSIIYCGQTLHEFKNRKDVRGYRSLSQNFQEVFGPWWMINFIMPMQYFFKQKEFEKPYVAIDNSNGVLNGGHHVLIDMENV